MSFRSVQSVAVHEETSLCLTDKNSGRTVLERRSSIFVCETCCCCGDCSGLSITSAECVGFQAAKVLMERAAGIFVRTVAAQEEWGAILM